MHNFYDHKMFTHDLQASIDASACWVLIGLLGVILGLRLTKSISGMRLWLSNYLLFYVLGFEMLMNLLFKSMGYEQLSPTFNMLSLMQAVFLMMAIYLLICGIKNLPVQRLAGIGQSMGGIVCVLVSSLLAFASQYEHWGIDYMLISHIKYFIAGIILGAILLLKLNQLKVNGG